MIKFEGCIFKKESFVSAEIRYLDGYFISILTTSGILKTQGIINYEVAKDFIDRLYDLLQE